MKVGNRELSVVLSALFEKRHYTAARNMLQRYHHPAEVFGRYLLDAALPCGRRDSHADRDLSPHRLQP
jgi:hypothetical protein